jgi:hypothetical protein
MNINDFGMPHTSIGGDREYGSAEWREYFNTLVKNGVVPGRDNELEVKPQGTPNKTVYIDLGAIFINGAIRIVDNVINLSFTDNTSGSTRIDRVVARLNLQESTRKLEFAVKEGDPGGGAPALTQTADIYEVSLAQVELANGYSTITSSEITDEREFSKIKVMFDADVLDGQLPSYYLSRDNHTGTQLASTISNFAATVRSTVLNGLSTATNAVISSADSILTALGKLQAQITATKNTADSHIANTSNPHSVDKSDVGLGSVANYPVATQAEAEAGASNSDYMTPLRTKEAIDFNGKVIGTYTGDGNTSQTINIGFTPSAVIISSPLGSFLYPGVSGRVYGGMITENTLSGSSSAGGIVTNGFIVYYDGDIYTNRNGDLFSYIAYK